MFPKRLWQHDQRMAWTKRKRRHFGRNCLIARRLIENDVRFVQVWSGMGGPTNNWDNHTDIVKELPFIAKTVDQPISALLADLKQRGLLDDTLVIWTTEFGRMPFTQGATGRDHNGGTFVTWLAGLVSNPVRPTARVTSLLTRRPRTEPIVTTCTPRSCTCWASTIVA